MTERKRTRKNAKPLIIAAASLVAVLAVGGVGFTLANGEDTPTSGAQTVQTTPAPSESGTPLDPNEDEAATMGGPSEDEAKKGSDDASGIPQDGQPATGGQQTTQANQPKNPDKGSAGTNTHTSKPTTPAADKGDTPADGPAGEFAGQCAKSGC